jgi:dipeptidyl-peptidase 4
MIRFNSGIFVFSVFMFSLVTLQAQTGEKKFTLEDFSKNYSFPAKGIQGLTSMKDGEHYTALEGYGTKIVRHSYATGEVVKTILDLAELKTDKIAAISGYTFCLDETRILLQTNKDYIYRRSYTAEFYIYEIKTQKLIPLSAKGKQQLATFSPDGTKVAFVRENNLFITFLADGSEMQVTQDGKFNEIINGAPDWVYEEEFGFTKAFEWSPDGAYLAFMRFDESKVHEFSMILFEGAEPELTENALYPQTSSFKYPKAGEANSVVSVYTYSLASGNTVAIDIGNNTDIYIPRIRWTKSATALSVFRLNRLQNDFEILLADPITGISRPVYQEINKCYIDEANFDNVIFLDDNKHFIITSERDGWSHLYLYDLNGKLVNQITKGDWDVTGYLGFDAQSKRIYYSSAETSPLCRSIYSIRLDGSGKLLLSAKEGTNSAEFSSGCKYYINTYSCITDPPLITLHTNTGEQIRVLEENKLLVDKLKGYAFNFKEFFSFSTPEGVRLNGFFIKPAGFDPSVRYPVLMTQYSGPNSQEVLNKWSLSWEDFIAQQGYIIVCVDGRGTGGRGEAFRKVTYMQLGKYETIDQIEAARYIGRLPFIDSTRIGIWGWSYGGYISSSCMVKSKGIFKAGIAVAPVTNWRYYDNIFTERFMRTPQENPEGYDQNSPLNFAEGLNGKLLLCHGTADDNVHVQNTMEFSERLVQANKQFEMQLYTNRNHNIYGGNTRYHLYIRLTAFILKNL